MSPNGYEITPLTLSELNPQQLVPKRKQSAKTKIAQRETLAVPRPGCHEGSSGREFQNVNS